MTGKGEHVLSFLGEAVGDFLFPKICMVCGNDTHTLPLCDDCLGKIQKIERNFCQLCGKPLPRSRRSHVCSQCMRKPLALSRIRAWARFTHPLDRLVYSFKYSRFSGLADFFASKLSPIIRSDGELSRADALVPIPLHSTKRWFRGYNQSEKLANSLSKMIGIPTTDCLKRGRMTRTQTRLTPAQRRKNVAGAFTLKTSVDLVCIQDSKLILIDDVITSGSTLDAAAEVLLNAGAARVSGLTIGGAWIER